MIYSSLLFIYAFLPMSMLLYRFSPEKYKNAVLLVLSLIFCAFSGLRAAIFMTVYTLVNYAAGIGISRVKKSGGRGVIPAAVGIILDLGALFFFRGDTLSGLRELLRVPDSFFPLGISLFTLSAIGYLTDVLHGRTEAEKDIVSFGLYILMFPKLLMGPVVRYGAFRRMLGGRRTGLHETGIGLTIFVKGLTKKAVAADSLYMLYKAVRSTDVESVAAVTAWLGAIAYLLCLYFTLSGFADMGTGVARCFGFRFPQSFNYPLFSSRIRYFAARWHIQVIRWFRRTITKPLSDLTSQRWLRTLIFIAAWGILGFWYRFSANSLIWGMLLGLSIVMESRINRLKMLKATGVIYTFIITVILGVFLSGDTVTYSMKYLFAMIGGTRNLADSLTVYLLRSYLVVVLLAMYASSDLFRSMLMRSGKTKLRTAVTAATPVIVVGLLVICTALMAYSGSSGMLLMKL